MSLYFVDLSGYGYADVSVEAKKQWGRMIENYLNLSRNLKCIFLLVDIRHKPSENDKLMYEWILKRGFEPVIIATKLDKIKRSVLERHRLNSRNFFQIIRLSFLFLIMIIINLKLMFPQLIHILKRTVL